jgi:methylenetetrahydrofolate reductase (NADPH)
MNTGNPPGCWASDELVAFLRKESEAPDGGLQARLERAAKSVAILKGIGYAGAYIGGTHDAKHITQIIRRAEELAPRWEENRRGTAVRQEGRLLPVQARSAAEADAHLPAHGDGCGAKTLPFVPWSKNVTDSPGAPRVGRRVSAGSIGIHCLSHWFERFEFYSKKEVCWLSETAANCVLGHMEYVCPQTCPKQMRNGPVRRHVPRCPARSSIRSVSG